MHLIALSGYLGRSVGCRQEIKVSCQTHVSCIEAGLQGFPEAESTASSGLCRRRERWAGAQDTCLPAERQMAQEWGGDRFCPSHIKKKKVTLDRRRLMLRWCKCNMKTVTCSSYRMWKELISVAPKLSIISMKIQVAVYINMWLKLGPALYYSNVEYKVAMSKISVF